MKNIYLNLFNLVLDTGIAPEVWSIGCICPIYKQKGSTADPANYRPITLLSCMGKFFTSIINDRLLHFSEKYEKINECQAGFRSGFSTVDNMLVLNTLLNYCKIIRKKIVLCVYRFTTCLRYCLEKWFVDKLNMFTINGNCFQLIRNMYKK